MSSEERAEARRKAELSRRIAEHPATTALTIWRSLGRVFQAYARNSDELLSLIASPGFEPEMALNLMSVEQGDTREQYFDELFRRLHNYLSARSTLIEHSRRFTKPYAKSDFYLEYERRKDEVGLLGVARFLQDLRNYLIHHRVPPFSLELSLREADPGHTFEVTFNAKRLLESHDWNADAKDYIRARDRIVLLECMEEINEKTTHLYDWLFSQFKVLHARDLEDIEPLQAELREIVAAEGQPVSRDLHDSEK